MSKGGVRKFKGPDPNFDGITLNPAGTTLNCALCGHPIYERDRATWFTPSGIQRTLEKGEHIKKHISGPTSAACPNCCLKLVQPIDKGGYGQKVRWSDPEAKNQPTEQDPRRTRLAKLNLTPEQIEKALNPTIKVPQAIEAPYEKGKPLSKVNVVITQAMLLNSVWDTHGSIPDNPDVAKRFGTILGNLAFKINPLLRG